jgi:hypothetical protein
MNTHNVRWRNDGGQDWNMKSSQDANTIVRFGDLAQMLQQLKFLRKDR